MLIHIGYHKTGTSWLQNAILQPRYGYAQMACHAEIDRMIVRPHGLLFDPQNVRAEFEARRYRKPAGLVPVLSSEILSGHPFFGGIGSDILADRIAQVWPAAKILITIRSQMTMLPSIYLQYLQRGGTLNAPEFFAGTRTPGYHGFAPEHFEYYRLIRRYFDQFENVGVITHEALLQQPEQTLNRLREFAGSSGSDTYRPEDLATRSLSPPESAAPIFRRLNHVRRSELNPSPVLALASEDGRLYRTTRRLCSALLSRKSHPIRTYVERTFHNRYVASNQTLDRLMKGALDLSAYPQVASSPCFQGSALTKAAGPVSAL